MLTIKMLTMRVSLIKLVVLLLSGLAGGVTAIPVLAETPDISPQFKSDTEFNSLPLSNPENKEPVREMVEVASTLLPTEDAKFGIADLSALEILSTPESTVPQSEAAPSKPETATTTPDSLAVSWSASDLKIDNTMPALASPAPASELADLSIAQSSKASPAAAPLERRNGVYLTFYGIPVQGRKSAEDFIGRATFSTGTGLGGAVGYRFKDVRFDAEISYFKNKFDELTFFQPGTTTPVPGPSERSPGAFVEGRAVMFNLYYDIPIRGSRISPYIGAGVGSYNAYINDLSPPAFGGFVANGKSSDRFAYQLRSGVTYIASQNLDLFIGYRYFKGNEFEYVIPGFPVALRPNGLQSHSLELGLRYQF